MNKGLLNGTHTGRFVQQAPLPDYVDSKGGTVVFTHNRGLAPFYVRWVVVNQLPEGGYVPGDEVTINGIGDISAAPGTWANAAQCGISIYQGINSISFLTKDGTSVQSISVAKWALKCYALFLA